MSRVEPLGLSKAGQTLLARLMESQIWHQLASSVGRGFSKGTTDSSCPDARHFISPCMLLMPFKLPPWCWSSERASLSRWVRVWVPQEELLRAPAASSTDSIPAGSEVVGTYLPGTRILETWWDLGDLVWVWDSSFLRYSSGIFIHMGGCQHVRVCTPPASLDGCGFLNSVLVRLPFN